MDQGEFESAFRMVKNLRSKKGVKDPWNTMLQVFKDHPMYKGTIIQRAKKLFFSSPHKVRYNIDDGFIWDLAEALLWRDEEVSIVAIPSPIREQPEAKRYYEDALYLIRYVCDKKLEADQITD